MIKVEGLCMKWELISITEKVLGEKVRKMWIVPRCLVMCPTT